jgi:hypothetical protein
VPHDPEYYFHGEEISIAVRAFTHGYDLFHPHKIIAWHEYTRKGRKKQWDDDTTWTERNKKSHERNKKLLGVDGIQNDIDFGRYGLGTVRTIDEYERYAGIRFSDRSVQDFTLKNKLAPNPIINDPDEYNNSFLKIFKYCIDVDLSKFPETDYEFWVVAFHNKNQETLYRKDADKREVQQILNSSNNHGTLWRTFHMTDEVTTWVIWPYSTSKGWCERITGKI